jgi:hemoglobin-like flavoprotein
MMMAHDSSHTPPSRLDDESVNALRIALRAYLHDAEEPSGLQAALHRIAVEARERAILPEQLLVVLKEVWSALPEVRSMTESRQQVNLLQRVVTMCIREYYSA